MTGIDFQAKIRLKFNRHASRTAYERLKVATNENDSHEIYTAIGELLLWVITTEEWHLAHGDKDYIKRRNEGKGVLIKGLRHAYNMVKHNMDFINIHQKEGGLTFPLEFPESIPEITVVWMKAGEVLTGRHESQKDNYINFVEGKEVLKTFNRALTFLNGESYKYILE